jgi:hypothetical protein
MVIFFFFLKKETKKVSGLEKKAKKERSRLEKN